MNSSSPTAGFLCLENGTLDIEAGRLVAHSPSYRLRTCLQVPWSEEAQCPGFLSFLESVFRDDADKEQKILFVQEWMGYLLVPDASQQKMLWLVGQGANGKSVLLHVISQLVGPENISNAMLEQLQQTYVRAELEGKLLNISGEIAANAMIDDGIIKAIVAGDTVQAERKYKPSFSFRPYVRLMAATNSLPRTNDVTHGFFRRTVILRFNRVFTDAEQNPRLADELQAELSGILRWAMTGLHRLRLQGGFTVPPSSQEALGQYRLHANSVALFAEECLVQTGRDGGMRPAEVFQGFQQWARANGFQTFNIVNFGQRLAALGFEKRKSNGRELWMVAAKPDAHTTYFSWDAPVASEAPEPDAA